MILCRQRHKCRRIYCLTLYCVILSVCFQLAFKILDGTHVSHTILSVHLLITLFGLTWFAYSSLIHRVLRSYALQIMQEMFTLTSEMRIICLHFLRMINPVAPIPQGTPRLALPRAVHTAHEFLCSICRLQIRVPDTGEFHCFAEKSVVTCEGPILNWNVWWSGFLRKLNWIWCHLKKRNAPCSLYLTDSGDIYIAC